MSFTDSVNGYITFAFPFKLLFFPKLLIICLGFLPSPSLICSSSRRRASKCLVIQPPLLHFCHFAASIRVSFVCLCSVSDGQEMLQKQNIPKEKNHQYLFWMLNLKMIDCFSSQKKRRVIRKCMLWIYLSSLHWLWICHCFKKHTRIKKLCSRYIVFNYIFFLFLSHVLLLLK